MDNHLSDSNVKISEDAISAIIELAVNEIEGVSVFESGFAAKLTKKRPIHINMSDDSISIEVLINIKYGETVKDIAPKIQENIKTNIEIMTSLQVSNIDIHVMGII